MRCGSCNQEIRATAGWVTCQNYIFDGHGIQTTEICGALVPGVRLSYERWEIEKCIGSGGQGRAYRAQDTHIRRTVVVKELIDPTESPTCTPKQRQEYQEAEKRFVREAELLMRFKHNRIPTIHDQFKGAAPSRHYIVMDFINGQTLEKVLETYPTGVSVERAIRWTIQILEVLEHIHQAQPEAICHRDLKPGNVILRNDNGAGIDDLVLIDFGIARGRTGSNNGTAKLGTFSYAAPEIFSGALEPRSDLFATGAMLYEFLTGICPPGIDIHTRQTNISPLTEIMPGIAPDLCRIVKMSTQYDTRDRYDSATDFKADLEAFVAKGSSAFSYGTTQGASTASRTTVILRKPAKGDPSLAQPAQPVQPSAPSFVSRRLPRELGEVMMVYVPPGPFTMGTDIQTVRQLMTRFPTMLEEDLLAECPQRIEVIGNKGFWISQSPITNAEYQIFLAACPQIPVPASEASRKVISSPYRTTGSIAADRYDWNRRTRTPPPGLEKHPVVNVTWYEANAYALWIGGRLPREKEWERAARGTDGRAFPWGYEEVLTKCHSNASGTIDVGTYFLGISPAGCLDMAGNVRQWMSDPWQGYPGSSFRHPAYDPQSMVTRGSHWQDCAIPRLRTSFRTYAAPGQRSAIIGFRVVRDAT